MKKLILLSIVVLLSGCARNQCEIAIDSLQPVQKIPKVANIEIGDSIMADDGGNTMLKNYVTMSTELNNVITNCQTKK